MLKKSSTVILLLCTIFFMLQVIPAAAAGTDVTIETDSTTFFKDTIEIFKAEAGSVTASLPVQSSGILTGALLAAAYVGNTLEDVSFKTVDIIAGGNLLISNPVVLSGANSVLKVLLWDGVKPLDKPVTLDSSSWEKKINSFSLTFTSATNGTYTYTGAINEETKAIVVDVPTLMISSTVGGNPYWHTSQLKTEEFSAQIADITPEIDCSLGAVPSGAIANADLSSPKTVTVTAQNGTKTVYTVRTDESILYRSLTVDCESSIMVPTSTYYAARRAGMPVGGALGPGIFYQAESTVKFSYAKDTNGDYILDEEDNYVVDTDKSYGYFSLVDDPEMSTVYRIFKNKTGTSLGLVSTSGNNKITAGTAKVHMDLRFKYDSISSGDGTRIGIANIFHIVGKRKDDTHYTFAYRYKSGTGTITAMPDTPTLNTGQWYALRAVAYVTPVDAANYTINYEIYIDGKYITTLTDNYTDDLSLDNNVLLSNFYDTNMDMSIKDFTLTYMMR